MKKILKWAGIVIALLVVLVVAAVGALFVVSNSRLNANYQISPEPVAIPADDEAIAQGEHIATIRGCADCHNGDLSGNPFIEDPALGNLYASNLTAGQGGVGGSYSDADWVRAIRHGVGPDGKPLLFMPAQEFYFLSDEDLGALIAYIKSVTPVDKTLPENSIGPLGRVLFLAGQLPLIPAEMVDHNAPRPVAPEPGVTVEYGQYMAVGCVGCHGPNFSGGPITGVPPDWPPASNLTPAGNLKNWSEDDFITAMRTGLTPEGYNLNATYMPWPGLGQMTDDELKAIWVYLQSLPPAPTGQR